MLSFGYRMILPNGRSVHSEPVLLIAMQKLTNRLQLYRAGLITYRCLADVGRLRLLRVER